MRVIARSGGMPTGRVGLMAGSGGAGITEALDAEVVAAAEALREAFGSDVEIRFNSDRRSGGAWLKGEGASIASDVGITVSLVDVAELRRLVELLPDPDDPGVEETLAAIFARDGQAEPVPDTYLRRAVMTSARVLRDETVATAGAGEHRYAHVGVAGVDDAVAWLRANVRVSEDA